MLRVHATAVVIDDIGVLLCGPPGCGKSDLALRLIDGGASLVADDQTELERRGSVVVAHAPATIAGLMEVRGLGIVRVRTAAAATVGLVVDLVEPRQVERLPPPDHAEILGISIPRLRLTPFEASACAKLRLAVVSQKVAIIPAS